MAATGKVIGTVTAVAGEAKATAADGTVRILQIGDVVLSDEVVTTSAGGSINIALASGKTLDCGGDIELALHESILGVATAASPATSAPASDIDALQRAIAAGEDPSQVAAATAAGGAPAAGGAGADGGSHEPVVLEQSNSATVVTSGFTTEGDTISFPDAAVVADGPVAVISAPVVPDVGIEAPAAPTIPAFESAGVPQGEAIAAGTLAAVNVIEPSQTETPPSVEAGPAIVENSPSPVASSDNSPASEDAPVVPNAIPASDAEAREEVAGNDQPQIVVLEPAEETVALNPDTEEDAGENEQPPAVVAQPEEETVALNPDTEEDAGESEQPPVVVTEPEEETVALNPDTEEDTGESNQPPVVVTQPEDEIVVVTEPEDDDIPEIPVDDSPADLPDSTSEGTTSLTYSISANTNQDEQLALLTFENDGHEFQSLVFFHQQGQQKPMAVPLEFEIDYDASTTVTLEYIDAFAGNSDASTGHTAQKIAIKDFSLGEEGANTLLAQESDGVNIGFVGRTTQTAGTVEVDMDDPSDPADESGPVGDWTFTNPADVHDRVAYDGDPLADTNGGFDILDVSGDLDLTALDDADLENFEVIALKGPDAQTLTLSVDEVLKVTDGEDVLHIIGGKEQVKGDTVHDTLNVVGSDWSVVDGDSSVAGIQPSYFGWVQVKHSAGATLLVDPDVNINLLG